MINLKDEIKTVRVTGLCRLIGEKKISIGDKFMVIDKNFRGVEIVFDIVEGHCADTITTDSIFGNIVERRYFVSGGYAICIGANYIGTKPYHRLLREAK